MERKIVIRVDADGNVQIEALGFAGCGCTEATRVIEAALGGRAERSLKPEFYVEDSTEQQVLGQGMAERW